MKGKLQIFGALAFVALILTALTVGRVDGQLRPIVSGAVVDSLAAASAAADTLLDARIEADSLRLDSLKYIFGEPADTSSPGLAYYLSAAASLWHRADTSISVKALAICVDSVPSGTTCRFQTTGLFSDPDWSWTPGTQLVSHISIAGGISATDAARDSTLKMQNYATAFTATDIWINIDNHVWTWVTP